MIHGSEPSKVENAARIDGIHDVKRTKALKDKTPQLNELTFTSSLTLQRSQICEEFIDLSLTNVRVLGNIDFDNAYVAVAFCLTRKVDIVIDPSHAFNWRLCDPPGSTSINKTCLVFCEDTAWWFLVKMYEMAGGSSKLLDLLYI